jgi:putative Mg2+ transporter-C (MgtC) family protein
MATTLIDWQVLLTTAGKIGFAYALTLPMGFWREREEHAVGIRTFPIVATASCGYILKDGLSVRGTATAASIWNTGAIGASVAMERYEAAIVLAFLNLITLLALLPLKKRLDGPER